MSKSAMYRAASEADIPVQAAQTFYDRGVSDERKRHEEVTIDRLYAEYCRGMEDERASHELRQWTTMPDVDGWYFYDGNVYDKGDVVERLHRKIVALDKALRLLEFDGTWYGPLTPPWKADSE